jgi:hypothetical protein
MPAPRFVMSRTVQYCTPVFPRKNNSAPLSIFVLPESNTFGVILPEPFFRIILVGKNLHVMGVANFDVRIDVDQNGFHKSSRINGELQHSKKRRAGSRSVERER